MKTKTNAKKHNGNPNKRFHYDPDRARPISGQQAAELHAFGTIARWPNGLSYAMAPDVAENTSIPRPPTGREEVPVQISRLLTAHEIILMEARGSAKKAAGMGDDGTNDLLVSSVVRTNEMQVWFVAEHLVDAPQVIA